MLQQFIDRAFRPLLQFQNLTERRSVMFDSVMAAVDRRNGHGNHFALSAAQRTFGIHQFPEQVVMQRSCFAVNAVNTQNMIRVRKTVFSGDFFKGNILDKSHR